MSILTSTTKASTKKRAVERLCGSLKSSVPYTDMKTVRKKMGKILGEKYKVAK